MKGIAQCTQQEMIVMVVNWHVYTFFQQNMNNQSNISIVPTTTNAQVENERPMMRRPLETVTCYKVCINTVLA